MKHLEFPHEQVKFLDRFWAWNEEINDNIIDLYCSYSIEYFENKGERIREFFNMPHSFILTREDNRYYAAINASKQMLLECDNIKFWRVFKGLYVPELIRHMCKKYKHCHRYGLISNHHNSAHVYLRKRQIGWWSIESI